MKELRMADATAKRPEPRTREHEEPEELHARELSALSIHLQALAELEKSQLARKLHDELGGLLTAAKMDLSWLQSRIEDSVLQERMMQLGGVLDEAMDLKRHVVEELRPSLLDHFGLPTAVRAYVESACAKAGLESEIAVAGSFETLPKATAIALFRVMQEGLSNIIRHARARLVHLELTCDERHCLLALTDDGVGFDSQAVRARGSCGLTGIRQRAIALGGQLSIDSRTGGGTRLQVEIPYPRG